MATAEQVDLDGNIIDISSNEELVDLTKEPIKDKVKKKESKEETELPEHYKDKSAEDLIVMNEAAQKQISKQGNEIGELRKLTDKILQQQLEKTTKTKPTEKDEELDWEYDTQGSVKKIVDSRVKALEEKIETTERQSQFERFETQHPDWDKISNDADFLKWVEASRFRTRLYNQANNHDYDAADDLFTEYENLNKVTEEQEQMEEGTKELERKSQLKAASLEKGGSSGVTKKIFSRAALIHLKLNDPAKYEAMAEEIYKAYAEKRVR